MNIISVWSKFYKRTFLEKNSIQFENIIPEDCLFNFEVFRRNPQVIMTDCKVYGYIRDNQNSILLSPTPKASAKLINGRIYVLNMLNRYLCTEGWDMKGGLTYYICWYLDRFYSRMFYVQQPKEVWKKYMFQIRKMGVNKFLFEREKTIKRKIETFMKCSASYSYPMYMLMGYLYRSILRRARV